jgi:putative effector of murein hydrolase
MCYIGNFLHTRFTSYKIVVRIITFLYRKSVINIAHAFYISHVYLSESSSPSFCKVFCGLNAP